MNTELPNHLKKYIVEQNYEKYTPVDQACWRYILRQLRAFLSVHAHECYQDGLEKTGISVERIPKIPAISKKLEQFGWKAIPVSGFIPPAAFMELQSLGFLPIASDMRSLEHLSYTPAPDIVHEAAGHAPILVHPEFAAYLKKYAVIAKKAIISSEDLALYEAIRNLSDLKENGASTNSEVDAAQENLNQVSKSMSHVSEASELSRLNWWTAEYGLVGNLASPKIYGAGLLSSVSEAKHCLSAEVKKIHLSLECIKTGYDITEPQPQLFVTSSFAELGVVLEKFAKTMAFNLGGTVGLEKAEKAQTVTTVQLDSGLQISGVMKGSLRDASKQIIYLRTVGPTQLSYLDRELAGHSTKTHPEGFGTPLGNFTQKTHSGIHTLEFSSGIKVSGELINTGAQQHIMTFKNCRVTFGDEVLFDPAWGNYDMALGSSIQSVFGGPADASAYGELEDFPAKRVVPQKISATELKLHALYQKVRSIREGNTSAQKAETELKKVSAELDKDFPEDWLLRLEIFEYCQSRLPETALLDHTGKSLSDLKSHRPRLKSVIDEGLALLNP